MSTIKIDSKKAREFQLDVLEIVKPLHIYLSWAAGLLVVGHLVAALKHHFIDKDTVLISMTRQPK